jgi:3-hydroxyisobutyrate dehydrogenase-like beta-hydroxyacid dehydrogenase
MRIGFIGTGRMGAPMVRHLAAAGNEIIAFDAEPAALAKVTGIARVHVAASAAEAAGGAEVVCTSLPGPREAESVAFGPDGLVATMRPGSIYVDLSTNAPALVRRIATALSQRGADMIDAPVSGGVEGAEAATLTIMAGGSADAFQRVRPLLDTIASRVYYCGAAGNGSIVKLCNNICGAAYTLILSEALTLGVKAGVDLATLASVIGASTGSSARLTNRFPRYLFRRNFEPGFSASLSLKDTNLALELADQTEVPLTMAARVRDEMSAVIDRGWGERDFDVVALLQEERAGVVLELKEGD